MSACELHIKWVRSSGELEQVKALFSEYMAMSHYETRCGEVDSVTEMASLPEPYVEPGGAILMASLDAEPVGCVALAPFSTQTTCEMRRLYVTPETRGQGVGRALVAEIVEVACELGYRTMRLDTSPELTAALGLYAEVGFSRILSGDEQGACSLSFEMSLVNRS